MPNGIHSVQKAASVCVGGCHGTLCLARP